MAHTKITREEVEHIAELAKLRFNDDEIETFVDQFDRIVSYVEKLNEVDTEGVEPMARVGDADVEPREDEVGDMLSQEDAVRNAPARREGFFSVPKVMGDTPE
jgi:aspartyl-tRNA(Asn)/glutamyl-tRNA(Gln) amidotransferase subunit C